MDARSIADELRSESFLPSRGTVDILNTPVPSGVAYREAATHRMPVHRFDARRRGAGPCAAETMAALASELFPHLHAKAQAPARKAEEPA